MISRRIPSSLATDRFPLTLLGPDDESALHTLWTDVDVRRYLWDGESVPRSQTREILGRNLELHAEQGFGLWGVRDGEALVGFAGFWHFRDPPDLELLFGVARARWGEGIATEAARVVVAAGFAELGWESIDASTDVGNEASVRVLAKLGFDPVRREIIDGLDTLFYRRLATPEGD